VLLDRAPVRLGHDVFTKGRIETGVIGAACEALRRFRTAMDAAKVDRYRAVATSAAREASNGDVFVERAEREAGVHVEVIEGVEEARLVQLAVVERVPLGRARPSSSTSAAARPSSRSCRRAQRLQPVLPGRHRAPRRGLPRRRKASRRIAPRLIEEYVDRAIADAVRDIARRADALDRSARRHRRQHRDPRRPLPHPRARSPRAARSRSRAMARALDVLCKSHRRGARRRVQPAARSRRHHHPGGLVLSRVAGASASPGSRARRRPEGGVLVDLAREHFMPADDSGTTSAITDACLRLGRRYHFDERHGLLVAQFATQPLRRARRRTTCSPRDRLLLCRREHLARRGRLHPLRRPPQAQLLPHRPQRRDGPHAARARARRERRALPPQEPPPSVDHENFRALSREDRGQA
jgi:exopolyphosphatase/guanosine-5'-triphosphate,3'-diphosphate pyrophosphatase